MKRSGALKRSKGLARARWARSWRRKPSQRERASAWRSAVMRASDGRCVVTGKNAGAAHHVIPKHLLKKHDLHAHLWDARNGIAVTTRVHDRHHAGLELIPASCLPASVYEFAAEHGLIWFLEKHYATEEVSA